MDPQDLPELNRETDAGSTPESADGSASTNKPTPRAEIFIFDNWCKGCGLCVAFCPRGVLKVNGSGRVHVVSPELCTACEWCETHCPDFAIVVRRLDEALSRR
ncbi:MAG: 4Fe-4S binding protein [Chloroflexota bacterium]